MSSAERESLDLESRLRRLAPAEPVPPRLRARVLRAVEEALESSQVPRLDRWLARPWPWFAAAAALVLVFLAGRASEGAFARRVALPPLPVSRGGDDVQTLRRFLHPELVLARVGPRAGGGER